jgi:hypothetical protein
LPRKPGKIRKAFVDALGRGETLVIYESPFRAAKTLELLAEVAPEALVCACRELTKHFEETLRGTAGEVAANLRARKEVKGEFTIVIAPRRTLCLSTKTTTNNWPSPFVETMSWKCGKPFERCARAVAILKCSSFKEFLWRLPNRFPIPCLLLNLSPSVRPLWRAPNARSAAKPWLICRF